MWLLLACVAPPPPPVDADSARADTARPDTGTPDTASTTDSASTTDTDTSPYVGERLDPPLDPPVFAVRDQGGAWRTEADLVGHPTVLWFFREAEGAT